MKTDIHRDAINREAALMFAKGEKAVKLTKLQPNQFHSDVLPELEQSKFYEFAAKTSPNHWVDLRGLKYDRITVIGVSTLRAKAVTRVRWVVRCTCGFYEKRTAKSIKKRTGGMCRECARLEDLKISRSNWNISN